MDEDLDRLGFERIYMPDFERRLHIPQVYRRKEILRTAPQ